MVSTERVELRVLGPPDLRRRDGSRVLSVLSRPRRLALLTYVALENPAEYVRRSMIFPIFWPESDETHARAALRKAVYDLRQSLGEGVLAGSGADEIRLDPAGLWCDAVAFREAIREGEVERALTLCSGPFLQGLQARGIPEFDRWMEDQRNALGHLAIDAAVQMAQDTLAAAAPEKAARIAREGLERSPFEERLVRLLVRSLVESGNRAGAVVCYQEWTDRLAAEVGGIPGPRTRALLNEIQDSHATDDGPGSTRADPVPLVTHGTPPKGMEGQGEGPGEVRNEPRGGFAPRQRGWLPRTALLAGMAVVVGAGVFALSTRPNLPPPGWHVFAVLPFHFSGGEDYRYLSQGMMPLVGSALEQGTGSRVLDSRILVQGFGMQDGRARSLSEVDSLAGLQGATNLITGSILEAGSRLQIEASLFRQGQPEEVVRRAVVRGPVEDVFSLAEDLAHRLLPDLKGRRPVLTAQVRLTQSLPALEAYLEGEAELELGRCIAARDAFQRAVAYDSTFSLAYLRLALVQDWLGGEDVDATLINVVRTARRLSEGNAQLLGAFLARQRGDISRAATLAEALVAERPDMASAWFELGEIRFHYGAMLGYSVEEQVSPFRRVIELGSASAGALLHLARVDAREADSAGWHRLQELLRPLEFPAGERQQMEMLRAFRSGDSLALDSIMAVISETPLHSQSFQLRHLATASLDPDLLLRYEGRVESAGDGAEQRPGARLLASMLLAGRGEVRAALSELQPPWGHPSMSIMRVVLAVLPFVPRPDLPPSGPSQRRFFGLSVASLESSLDPWQPGHAFLCGLIYAVCGEMAAAEGIASDLLGAVGVSPSDAEVAEHNGRVLRAHLAWVRGNPAEALVILGPADAPAHGIRLTPENGYVEAHERFLRGESLLALGRHREALRWFSGFPEPGATDLHFIGIATLRQAQAREALGEKHEAMIAFEKFLDLWQEPDPELFPLVEAAREALERLSK